MVPRVDQLVNSLGKVPRGLEAELLAVERTVAESCLCYSKCSDSPGRLGRPGPPRTPLGAMNQTSDSKTRIVEAAKELFHRRGYNAVGVNEICRRAAVQKGSFYHFFPSKSHVALAAVEAHWVSFRRDVLAPAFANDLAPPDRIRRLFRMTCKFQKSTADANGQVPGCPFGNLALEMSTLNASLQEKLKEVFEGMAAYFETALDEAMAGRGLDPARLEQRARELVAYYQGAILLAKTRNEPALIEEMADGAVQLARAVI